MKKICFLFALLLIPTLISAKTVTCTSDSHFIIGQSVYNNTNVECSEGTVELFAVGKINYLENDYLAKEGESYYLDFLWTGEFNAGDTLLVDGDDQSDMGLGCDTGCHLISKYVEAEEGPDTGSGPEKEIAVGTIYYIGDRIKFNELLIILFADSDDAFAEIKKGSYTLPTPEYTEFAGNWLWIFDGFMREYGESDLVEFRFGYTLDISADKAPIGVKCTGGDGTMDAPFTFEPVYATDNNQTTDEPGVEYTILEGANQTYTKGSNGTITIKASGDLDKVIAIEIDNGNVIDPSNYELTSGSTILTLKTSFLENSSVGTHTITIKYDDGEVETNLTIVNANSDDPTTGDDTNQGTGDNQTTAPTGNATNNPETVDNIILYVALLGVSIMGLVGTGLYLREKRFN